MFDTNTKFNDIQILKNNAIKQIENAKDLEEINKTVLTFTEQLQIKHSTTQKLDAISDDVKVAAANAINEIHHLGSDLPKYLLTFFSDFKKCYHDKCEEPIENNNYTFWHLFSKCYPELKPVNLTQQEQNTYFNVTLSIVNILNDNGYILSIMNSTLFTTQCIFKSKYYNQNNYLTEKGIDYLKNHC